MNVFLSDTAKQWIEDLPPNIQSRIVKKLDFYSKQSDPRVFAKFIVTSKFHLYRFRIGDYRIFCHFQNDKMYVVAADKRDKAYK